MHLFLVSLAWIVKVVLYAFSIVLTLGIATAAIGTFTCRASYRGEKLVETGRFGVIACGLAFLWVFVRGVDMLVTHGLATAFDGLTALMDAPVAQQALMIWLGVCLGSYALFLIGALRAPKDLQKDILELRI